jgi:hypothetical protein
MRQLQRFLSFEGANAARLRNNADWLRGLPLMEFLRDTGKHFTLSLMLGKESVSSRLADGISFTEFSYMLIQAYDFWHLFKTEGCELQMGGSDQWGNITAGTHLVGKREGREVHGLVFPLLTTAAGGKFGKSEGENVCSTPSAPAPTTSTSSAQYRRPGGGAYQTLHLLGSIGSPRRWPSAAEPGRRGPANARAQSATRHGAAGERRPDQSRLVLALQDGASRPKRSADMPERRVSRAGLPEGCPVVEVLVASGWEAQGGCPARDSRQGLLSQRPPDR